MVFAGRSGSSGSMSGQAFILGFVVLSAFRDVFFAGALRTAPFFAVAFIAFAVCSAAFLASRCSRSGARCASCSRTGAPSC